MSAELRERINAAIDEAIKREVDEVIAGRDRELWTCGNRQGRLKMAMDLKATIATVFKTYYGGS